MLVLHHDRRPDWNSKQRLCFPWQGICRSSSRRSQLQVGVGVRRNRRECHESAGHVCLKSAAVRSSLKPTARGDIYAAVRSSLKPVVRGEITVFHCIKIHCKPRLHMVYCFYKMVMHIRCKVSQNKTEQIKCNDMNKNIILPPNKVVPEKWLWFQQSGAEQGVFVSFFYNSFKLGSTNQNQGPELSVLTYNMILYNTQ